jgi:hypothetical protein
VGHSEDGAEALNCPDSVVSVAHWAPHRYAAEKGWMTAEIVPRRSRKPKATPDALVIGEMNQTVFPCPACTRPLVIGARRCPGCGTRLVIGVQAKRAGILVAIGVFSGLILGGVLSTTATALGVAIQDTVAAVTAGSSPSPSISAASSPSAGAPTVGPGTISTVPALTRSALAQAVGVQARLTASRAVLASALKAKNLDSFGVSQTLRAMSADAVIGLSLSSHIGAWSGGKDLSGELTAFYTTIQDTASSGLQASVRNDKAYRAAGQRMLVVLGSLPTIDQRVHDVASEAGVVFIALESAAP